MKTDIKNKQGISLIVLVITIIIMIILAGVIIFTLSDTRIVPQAEGAVEEHDLDEIKTLAMLKWSDAYTAGNKTQEKLEAAVLKGLEEEGIDLSQYNIEVNIDGVEVKLSGYSNTSPVPGEWTMNVVAIVDTVPIPKGFVSSQATGENTKNGGLVIYEGTEPVTDANVENAKRTRNQYVWVPVENFKTKFVRGEYKNTTYSNVLGSGIWEVVLDTTTNMPNATQDSKYMTATTLAEVQAMYESVKEYEGFYIARYEAGIDVQRTAKGNAADLPGIKAGTKVYSVMGKIPYTYIPWTWNNSMSEDTNGAVQVARSVYPNDSTNTTGVISTLTYGVQWSRTLAWWLEVGAKDGKGNTITSVTNSTSYGNYRDHVINSQEDLNKDALVWDYTSSSTGSYVEKTSTTLTYPKVSGTSWGLSTGALKVASVNNIYDMAGNIGERTMEGSNTYDRITRGGYFDHLGNNGNFPVSSGGFGGDPYYTIIHSGFRSALYIKK